MKSLYFHTVLNAVVISWLIHQFVRSVASDPSMGFIYFFIAGLILLSFPGYVIRQFNEGK